MTNGNMNKKLFVIAGITVILLAGIFLAVIIRGGSEEEIIERVGPPVTVPGPADILETTLVDLFEVDGSGQSGFATIEEFEDQTRVVIQLIGDSNDNWSAVLRSGSCANPGEVRFELSDVSDGRSETLFDLPAGEVTGGSFLIAALSPDEPGEMVACGNR